MGGSNEYHSCLQKQNSTERTRVGRRNISHAFRTLHSLCVTSVKNYWDKRMNDESDEKGFRQRQTERQTNTVTLPKAERLDQRQRQTGNKRVSQV